MKAADIIEPLPMQTPIAASGSRDTIPQNQSDAQESWFCSIENGFPDITMQAQNAGGQPPRGQGANGLFYLSSDQKVYLQNGGLITFKQSVSDEIGGYPQGAVLDYINIRGEFAKVQSLVDDNTYNFVENGVNTDYWQILEFAGSSADLSSCADTDLSNLTADGNSKFQYAPFSINSGSIDASGGNNTLSTIGSTPVSVDKYVVPVLNSNSSAYGTCNDYTMTRTKTGGIFSMTNPFTIELSSDNYIPAGAQVIMTMSTNNTGQQISVSGNFYYQIAGCSGAVVTYTYTDDTTETILNENFSGWGSAGAHSITVNLPIASKTVKSISVRGKGWSGANYYPVYENYYNAWGITFRAQYTASNANSIICAPCTITTADGKTKIFEYDSLLDCTNTPDGSYKILKSYADGSLSLASSLTVQKTAPASPASGALWLDNSMYPLKLKQYNGSEWALNNDIVYIGDITISSGAISAIKNTGFNQFIKDEILDLATPDYSAGIAVTADENVKQAPSAGVLVLDLGDSNSRQDPCVYVGYDSSNVNTLIGTVNQTTSTSWVTMRFSIILPKGIYYRFTGYTGSYLNAVFYPMKGAV